MTAETNRTKTNIEAWIDYFSGYGVAASKKAHEALSTPLGKTCVKSAYEFIWLTPALAFQLAPRTFVASAIFGGTLGVFSSNSAKQISENVDKILSGPTDEKLDLRITLIYASYIINKFLPIPTFPTVIAAAAGGVLAFKYASWIPDSVAIPLAQAIDKLPLPKCPDFKP